MQGKNGQQQIDFCLSLTKLVLTISCFSQKGFLSKKFNIPSLNDSIVKNIVLEFYKATTQKSKSKSKKNRFLFYR